MEQLPKNWCIERNKDNFKIINEWLNKDGHNFYKDHMWIGVKDGKKITHSMDYKKNDLQEITFDDFRRLVLKQNIDNQPLIFN